MDYWCFGNCLSYDLNFFKDEIEKNFPHRVRFDLQNRLLCFADCRGQPKMAYFNKLLKKTFETNKNTTVYVRREKLSSTTLS